MVYIGIALPCCVLLGSTLVAWSSLRPPKEPSKIIFEATTGITEATRSIKCYVLDLRKELPEIEEGLPVNHRLRTANRELTVAFDVPLADVVKVARPRLKGKGLKEDFVRSMNAYTFSDEDGEYVIIRTAKVGPRKVPRTLVSVAYRASAFKSELYERTGVCLE